MVTHYDLGWKKEGCFGELDLIGDIYIQGGDWYVYECLSCKKVIWKAKDYDAAMISELNREETIRDFFSHEQGYLMKQLIR